VFLISAGRQNSLNATGSSLLGVLAGNIKPVPPGCGMGLATSSCDLPLIALSLRYFWMMFLIQASELSVEKKRKI